MRIHKKTLLIILVTFTLLSILLLALSNIIFLQSFQDLENSYVSENVGRIKDAILKEQLIIDGQVLDWGIWDATYAYIQGTNDDYIDTNLPNESFINIGINVALLINASGQLKYGKAFDLERNEEVPLSQNILKEILANSSFLLDFSSESVTHTGIYIFDDIPMMFSIGPILPNSGEGTPIGALFMGRYIDDEKIAYLETVTHVSFDLYHYDDLELLENIQKARLALSENQSIFVQPLDNDSIAGYTLLSNIYGSPCLIIEAEMPRSIYKHGQETLNYFFIFMIISDVIIAVVIIFLLQKTILSRLSNLSQNIRNIGLSGSSSARVTVSGNDEISSLAQDTNVMLEQISASQEKLKESEKKFKSIFDNANDGFISVDPESRRFFNANRKMIEMLGYESEEEIKNLTVSDIHPEKELPYILEEFEKHAKGEISRSECIPVKRKDGSIFFSAISSSPLKIANKTYLSCIFIDITERKRAEEELQESQQQLEKAYDEVKKLAQMKDDFINQLGHDLKTPLSPLLNLLPMVRGKEQDPKSKERLDVAIQSVNFMKELVVKTIELAKLRSGKITFDIQDINLASEVENILMNNKNLFESKSIAIENKINKDIIVRADRLQLSEVFNNLLSNAVKYSSSKGTITIDAKKEGDFVAISVMDNGIGLSQEQIEHIFDEFYKVDESRHEAGSVGLGLSICKRIVEIHGGKIWVTSPGIGKGSTFHFTLKKSNKK